MIKLTSFFDEFGVMTESWQMIQFVHLFQLLRKIVHLKQEFGVKLKTFLTFER